MVQRWLAHDATQLMAQAAHRTVAAKDIGELAKQTCNVAAASAAHVEVLGLGVPGLGLDGHLLHGLKRRLTVGLEATRGLVQFANGRAAPKVKAAVEANVEAKEVAGAGDFLAVHGRVRVAVVAAAARAHSGVTSIRHNLRRSTVAQDAALVVNLRRAAANLLIVAAAAAAAACDAHAVGELEVHCRQWGGRGCQLAA